MKFGHFTRILLLVAMLATGIASADTSASNRLLTR